MKTNKHIIRRLLTVALFSLTLIGFMPFKGQAQDQQVITLAYVEWSSEIASTNLVKTLIEDELGYRCEIIAMSADEMWEAVATGEADAMVAGWLPSTHSHFYEQYRDQIVDLGPNLEGTQTGLVVPQVSPGRQTAGTGLQNPPYITINSIEEMNDHVDKFQGRIIGIDREAGIMRQANEALEVYGLHDFELVTGSEVSMTAELGNAIRRLNWVVVTGWIPHWKFARWNLKFLEDPEGVFGGREQIHTIVRKGFADDAPEVYRFLDNFHWTPSDMDQLMLWIEEQKGVYPQDSARRWIRYNRELVDSWLP